MAPCGTPDLMLIWLELSPFATWATISNLKEKDLKGRHIPSCMGGHEVKEQKVLEILGLLIDNKDN